MSFPLTGYPMLTESFDWTGFDSSVDHVLLFDCNGRYPPKKLPNGDYILFAQHDTTLLDGRAFVPCCTDIIFKNYRFYFLTFPIPGTEAFKKCVQRCLFHDSFVERISGLIQINKHINIKEPVFIRAGEPIARLGFGKSFNPYDDYSRMGDVRGVAFYNDLPLANYNSVTASRLPKPIYPSSEDGSEKRMSVFAINMGLKCRDMAFPPKQVGPGDYIFMNQGYPKITPSGAHKIFLGSFCFNTEEPMILIFPLYGTHMQFTSKIVTRHVKRGEVINELLLEHTGGCEQKVCTPGMPIARLVSFWRERDAGPSNEFTSLLMRRGLHMITILPDAPFAPLTD